eukprot:s1127_g9.t1
MCRCAEEIESSTDQRLGCFLIAPVGTQDEKSRRCTRSAELEMFGRSIAGIADMEGIPTPMPVGLLNRVQSLELKLEDAPPLAQMDYFT